MPVRASPLTPPPLPSPRGPSRFRMSGEDGNEEFYRQLQLQQQYDAERGGGGEGEGEGEAAPDPFTYVDPADGAAYEWDREKKAWFPKVLRAGRARHGQGAGRARRGGGSAWLVCPALPTTSRRPFLRFCASKRIVREVRVRCRWEAVVLRRFLRVF